MTTVLFKLRSGEEILLDEEDYDRVAAHTWRIEKSRGTRIGIYCDIKIKGTYRKTSLSRFLLNCYGGAKVQRLAVASELDYRKCNLFQGCGGKARRRSGKQRGEYSSQYKGVYRLGARWRATIQIDGRTISLGMFDSEKSAAIAYDAGVLKYIGPLGFRNFS
ncbi:MAG: hypothetical protein EOP11_26085 [Proteobacteria bacterium]|nr:MAG: hypothetical protein EOP11_26085 [Pseudomonadota bacterium]